MQSISEYQQFESSVAGRSKKYASRDNKTFLKSSSHEQLEFYSWITKLTISQPSYQLVQCIPEFQGLTVIGLEKYMMFKNFKFGYNSFNGIDIKIGIRRPRPQNSHKPVMKLNYFIDGLKIHLPNESTKISSQSSPRLKQELSNASPEISSQSSPHLGQQQIIKLGRSDFKQLLLGEQDYKIFLKLFFCDKQHIRTKLLHKVIQKLKQVILAMKMFRNWMNYHASICIFYDRQNDQNFDIKFIDFQKSTFLGSQQVQNQTQIIGLQNLHRLLLQIMQENSQFNPQNILQTINSRKQYS